MKFNFKKISAVFTSGLMIVSGAAMAAAASFPAPFSDGTAANTAIVYGASAASTDVAAVTNINEYLKTKVTAEGGTPTGESFKIEKPSTKLNVGNETSDVWGSAITKADLPTLLADGTYRNVKNDEYKYTQQINMGHLAFNHFRDAEFNDNKPVLGFNITSQTTVFNYTLDFNTDPLATSATDLTDFENRNIQILGKNYYILDFKNATAWRASKITLLDSATSDSLGEGETRTIVVGGKSYDVALNFISSDQVKFDVKMPDGTTVTTEVLSSTSNTYNLGDGTYIGIRDILVQNYQGGAKSVTFSLGKGKLELTDAAGGGTVKINDKIITDLTAFITMQASGTSIAWQKLVIQWKVDDKKFLSTGSELVMPGFEAVKFTMAGISGLDTPEKTEVMTSGNSYVALKTTIKDGDITLPLFYVDTTSGNLSGLGESSTLRLASSNTTGLWYHYLYNGDNFERGFVASWASTKDFESYYLKFSNIHNDATDAKNYTDLTNILTGDSVCTNLYEGQTCNLGSITFTVNTVVWNATDKWVNVSINSGGSFNKLYTKGGLVTYLPFSTANSELNKPKGAISSLNTSVGYTNTGTGIIYNLTARYGSNVSSAGPWTLWFGEQDQYGTLDLKPFNMSIDGSGGTTNSKQTTVTNVDMGAGKFYETSSGSKLWEAYKVSQLATKGNWDKTSSNYNSASLEYHKGEVYANVFVTAAASTTGEVGNMIFTDAEKASWQGRNVILVGGSCINSATAELLGGPYCEAEFSANTGGVGEGQFMIASYADKFSAGKTAVVVAGYNAADTSAAAAYLLEKTVDTSAGKKYVGTVSATGTVDVTAM